MFNWFGGNGKAIFKLIKGSVLILGRDRDIYRPLTSMFIAKLIRIIAIFAIVYFICVAKSIGIVVVLFLFLSFYAFFESYYHMRCKAISTWMVYDILRGYDTDMPIAKKNLKGRGWSIFFYGLIEHVVTVMKNQRNSKGGFISMILSLLVSILAEVWDLVKNFTLPVIVIEGVGIKEAAGKLKLLKNKVPEVLAGVIGLDVAGGVTVYVFSILVTPFILAGIAAGFFLHNYLPEAWTLIDTQDGDKFNILPVYIVALIGCIFTCAVNSMVHLVKSSYFTTFYVSLTRPEEVVKELREHVSAYLDTDGRVEHYDFFADLDDEDDDDEQINKLVRIIDKNVKKGKSDKEVARALIKKGVDRLNVKTALKIYQKTKV